MINGGPTWPRNILARSHATLSFPRNLAESALLRSTENATAICMRHVRNLAERPHVFAVR